MTGKSIKSIVMFADVAGSTSMYENMGDEAARDRISKALNFLISICNRHQGKLVKTIGDEILVYFLDADMALLSAESIQKVMENDHSPETVGVSIRIGMHYGNIILEENDIFGDTVNVAARVVDLAKARQILTTKAVIDKVNSPELTNKSRTYDRIRLKGKDDVMSVFMFAWEEESEITNMATDGYLTFPYGVSKVESLSLTYHSYTHQINVKSPTQTLGRGKDCNLIVSGDLISRYHAKIEIRRGKFVLIDQSTNGTYIQTNDGRNIFLRREELTLFSSGTICLGKPVDKCEGNIIHFVCG